MSDDGRWHVIMMTDDVRGVLYRAGSSASSVAPPVFAGGEGGLDSGVGSSNVLSFAPRHPMSRKSPT